MSCVCTRARERAAYARSSVRASVRGCGREGGRERARARAAWGRGGAWRGGEEAQMHGIPCFIPKIWSAWGIDWLRESCAAQKERKDPGEKGGALRRCAYKRRIPERRRVRAAGGREGGREGGSKEGGEGGYWER